MSLLEVKDIDVHHGQLRALRSFSLTMNEGETVAVIGANGAGKSTLLGALAGLVKPTSGSVTFDGNNVTRLPAYRRVSIGIALVPEGRRLFKSLSVEENLKTGLYRGRSGPWNVQRVMELFEWMPERRNQNASQLSGGEQQAVAIGRALVGNPRLLLIDELSLGLAPIIVKRIYGILPRIVEEGTSVLIVEQDVSQALRIADRVHCLLEGHTVLEGAPTDFTQQQIESAYFGIGQAGEA
ncbi:MAG TPA: ABC transporter ATP-binding protein [Terrimesophilobacter sp.]|jgi:ABC-type branched-chain amino acid transport systems, ATPase component|uniref:ABC transporter ATP-binding protein n=1 Tax=Terrimesophilobacter sp. TaxID=2906435 RepID=UPI002F92077F